MDNEVKGEGNSLDFGERIYDPRLGRMLSIDKLSVKFPGESNYVFSGDNPIFFTDIAGNFKWPGDKKQQRMYEKKYPMFTKYMKENMKEILNSKRIMDALYKNSAGALSPDQIAKDIKYGEGPTLIPDLVNVGGMIKKGKVDYNKKDHAKSTMRINPELLDDFEKAMNDPKSTDFTKQSNLLSVMDVVLHEYTHYGDCLDGQRAIKDKDGNIKNGEGPAYSYEEEMGLPSDVIETGYETEYNIYGQVAGTWQENMQIIFRRRYGKSTFNPRDQTSKDSQAVTPSEIDESVLPTVPKKIK